MNFGNKLSREDWNDVISCRDVEVTYDDFVTKIKNLFDACFPIIQRRRKRLDINKPYINTELKSLIKQKHKLQKLYFKWPISYEGEYKHVRNLVNNKLRIAKRFYFCNKLNDVSGSAKCVWKILSELSGRKDSKEHCVRLNVDREIKTDN